MALIGQAVDFPIRSSNKEPEWSSLCNNVFDQYLDPDDPFAIDPELCERSSSNDSYNLFEFSTGSGSEQSHQTAGTSPIPSWDSVAVSGAEAIEAQQPTAKEPVDFWTKTLRALEQNAAASEKQQTLRAAKSHPDFLSLGGCPSPPAVPSSPTDQSLSVQRQRPRKQAANGRKASQARSLSRGRPSGVVKPTTAATQQRKASASPAKMMTPSRFRAGFKDVWTERGSPKKYELRVPSHPLPTSPPPGSAQQQDDFAAFGLPLPIPPNPYMPLSAYDEQLSPLTTHFQHTHIQTPLASSPEAVNAAAYASNASYFTEPLSPLFVPQRVPLNDTSPLFPEQTNAALAANSVQAFDFGFGDEVDPFSSAPFAEPLYTAEQLPLPDPFGGFDGSILPSIEPNGLPLAGLGISCDPSLVSSFDTTAPAKMLLPPSMYQQSAAAVASPYYVPHHATRASVPTTPHHRRSASRLRSLTPSPTPATDSRTRRGGSRSRRSSRHRRAKSTNATPRQPSNADKGGFVNFTPGDSNKILSGVAPSGSSKTKARREKEAADKRRKLSQAAVRAVVEAGGDLDALEKAGLL